MTKKRIFISMHYMELGGAEISLLGLLQAFDYSKYDVDLFIHRHQGELMQFIPPQVTLLPEINAYACIESPMIEALLRFQLGILWGRIKAKWRMRRYQPREVSKSQFAIFQYVAQEVEKHLPSLVQFGEYDLAISFLQPHNYVLSKVNAKKKACWIHTDYTKVEIDISAEMPIWAAYDTIVSISPDVTKTFLRIFPMLNNKILEIENILSPLFVRKRAKEDIIEEIPKDEGVVKVLSIGRFHEQKNFDNVPDICRRILGKGIAMKWYLIGYGDEELVQQKIKESKMEDYVIVLGKKANPYPYIEACDLYAQPSRYEGKAVTVREAQMLYKPVVITNYPTANSQIKNGIDGVIVPLDNEGCAQGMVDFIHNKKLQSHISTYLRTHDYGNEGEVEKIYRMI